MNEVFVRFAQAEYYQRISQAARLLIETLNNGGKILLCGNGGSMSDAQHFAEELAGRFRKTRKAFAAIALSDSAFLTCTANDFGYEAVFARGVEALGRKGDVLVALSTSGNSPNILRAAETAKTIEMQTLGLTGNDGGKLAALCDVEIRVPHVGYADRIQEIHIKVIHTLIACLEAELCSDEINGN